MDTILIVEDSRATAKGLSHLIQNQLDFSCDFAFDLAQAREKIMRDRNKYFLALLDLCLPDAPDGEVVDFMAENKVPSIVVTGTYDDQVRKNVMSKNVVDYIVKQHPGDIRHLLRVIKRIHNNAGTKVLVAEDSPAYRGYIKDILSNQRLIVFEAENGRQALDVINENPDISLVLTDYHMPVMDGYDLIQEIRRTHAEDGLSVIVLSSDETDDISPKFLKIGANDYIMKSASVEEFICRVNMNLSMLEMIREIQESANRDYLTGLYNRRYFFAEAEKVHAACLKQGRNLILAMIDIDYFKRINDAHGHLIGDKVLVKLASIIQAFVGKSGIAARFGGEEFCVLIEDSPDFDPAGFFEDIRGRIESSEIDPSGPVFCTVSIGVEKGSDNLERMISNADRLLYMAKEQGRNRVLVSD